MVIPNSFEILQAVIDATPDAIFVKDLEGRYILVNEAAARFVHRTPETMIGRHDSELYPAGTAEVFIQQDQEILASGVARSFEGVAVADDGTTQDYLVTKGVCKDRQGAISGLFGISHDMSELHAARQTLEQTREALFRSQKMEAVGQLTGGIAHDFNNILAVIIGSVELLRAYLPRDHEASDTINAILRAALHGRDLTSQLLAFSRRRLLNPQPVDIGALIRNSLRMFSRTLGETIRVIDAIDPQTGMVLADPAALEAAILNIALNARDAMPQGGTLTLRTERVDYRDRHASAAEIEPGTYVRLSLEDTGAGMPAEITARVFEPFFTTKAGGKGTGLGLSMVYGFAKQSGGGVSLTSTVGKGTTVALLLPADRRAAVPMPEDRETAAPKPRRILVVEDDSEVRNVVRSQLESLGHSVLVAERTSDALVLIRDNRPELLLTDVVLADGADGIDLAKEARRIMPSLPVVFMSGYTAVSEAQQRLRETGAPMLAKPFTTPQLDRAITDLFDTVR